MAGKRSGVKIQLTGEFDPRAFEQASARLEALRRQAVKNSVSIGGSFMRAGDKLNAFGAKAAAIGNKMTLGLTLPIALVGGAAVKMAMDAVESENLFSVSMGKMADSARTWSETTSKALGLNAYEVRKNVGTFDVMLGSMGLGEQKAYDMAKGLTQLSYDMTSFYDLKPAEAFEKLQSGISGEVEPLRRLGIIVNETTSKQWALQHGLIKSGETMTEQQKVVARYGSILEQTSMAQGDLARTADSPANKLRRLQEKGTELGIKFGTVLLPAMQKLVNGIGGVTEWLDRMSESSRNVVVVTAAIAASIGPALSGLGRLAQGFGAIESAAGLASGKILGMAGATGALIARLGMAVFLGVEAAKVFANIGHWGDDQATQWQRVYDAAGASKPLIALQAKLLGVTVDIHGATSDLTKVMDGLASAEMGAAVAIGTATTAWAEQSLTFSGSGNNRRAVTNEVVAMHSAQKALGDYLHGGGKKHTAEYNQLLLASQDAQRLVAQTAKTMSDREVDAAVKAGILTKHQGALAKKMNEAADKAQKLADKVKALKNKTIGVKVNFSGGGKVFGAAPIFGNGMSWSVRNFAQGDIVGATSGGRVVKVAEAGYDEAVIPINRTRRSMALLMETMGRMGVGTAGRGLSPASRASAARTTVIHIAAGAVQVVLPSGTPAGTRREAERGSNAGVKTAINQARMMGA